ncbi:p26 [Orgyia pseudotsugata multiple nucleopolyhedrovirus]|uniref:Poxin n=1 Tax=Orgyia pseudotsugata multicapsid polyhedrosis virus TaxID=262177 RepID=POXIN_NPVOP|nr:p26 [Orgyia pseudotsugata multiple nucleopolyhedrovirus]P11037.1 RecName: Full=Poxin [Orgyia pseudotsugata multiple nucleopolyhedrovirus]AAA46727.1 p26 [Orgyia pseudotsugata single capsid nuclopolyhedrovirus]AAC59131.1 p26 [Orgyia pseudotsugata multiple nucleopolyhedrovirus]
MYIKMEVEFDEDTGALQIGGQEVFVMVFEPGQEVFDKSLDQHHQFPGVATSVVFPQLSIGTKVDVFTSSGGFGATDHHCFNYHVCNKRFVFGSVPALEIPADVREHLRIGAPITCADRLVSLVTAVHAADGAWLLRVTAARAGQVSGHARQQRRGAGRTVRAGRSVYGPVQLPYEQLKAHAFRKRRPRRDAAESCALFYNDSEVRITFNKGEFELMHWRLPGPLVSHGFK